MRINGKHYKSIWLEKEKPPVVYIIDQRKLPFFVRVEKLTRPEHFVTAIKDMHVRGAPLIGITGVLGVVCAVWHALTNNKSRKWLLSQIRALERARPTAVNLQWAIREITRHLEEKLSEETFEKALETAKKLIAQEEQACYNIGVHGLPLLEKLASQIQNRPLHILTHCNAGWIACGDWGTVTAPIYMAVQKGINIHVWVSETRPRNQGARLTVWELQQEKIPCTLIADNASGYLIEQGMVDLVLVGADRIARNGDTANKIGTYMKAVCAHKKGIPFVVAAPLSTFDLECPSGAHIPIEERAPEEVTHIVGWLATHNRLATVRICPEETKAFNPAFDITPAELITAFITNRGIFATAEEAIKSMYEPAGDSTNTV